MRVPIQGVLIDLSGVLHIGDQPIPGAPDALRRLKDSGLPIRYVTNTTRSTRGMVLEKLSKMGFDIEVSQVFTAPIATRNYILQNDLRPYLLVHPNLQAEFADVDCAEPNAVVVGDAGDVFRYGTLNRAFRILMAGGALIAMGVNRYFRDQDGMSLDMGPFVEALRFASGVEPVIIGKPSASFFSQALGDMQVEASRAVIIGDDLENDVGGAQAYGMRGILVRTGKYRAEDERHGSIKPDWVVDDVWCATQLILQDQQHD